MRQDGSAFCSAGGPHPRIRLDKDYDGIDGMLLTLSAGIRLNDYIRGFGRSEEEREMHANDKWFVPLRVSEETLVSDVMSFIDRRLVCVSTLSFSFHSFK